MPINVKGNIRIIGKEAFIHPLTNPEIEFLLTLLADTEHKGKDIPKVLQVTHKQREEYKLVKEHSFQKKLNNWPISMADDGKWALREVTNRD